MKPTLKTDLILVAMLLICLSVAVAADHNKPDKSVPVADAAIDGEWHQTDCRGYFNSVRVNEVYEANDLKITMVNEKFYVCEQRGHEFLAVRTGDVMMWMYSAPNGNYLGIINCYGNCLVVNEIFLGNGMSSQVFVSANLYTKDGKIPGWFSFWEEPLRTSKWETYDACYQYNGVANKLSGHNMYILDSYGSVFRAEMEQDLGSGVTTKQIMGIVTDYVPGKYVRGLSIDDSATMWSFLYNGKTMITSACAVSDVAGPSLGKLVVAQRTYMEVNDTRLPEMAPSVIEKDSKWNLVQATYFQKGSDPTPSTSVSGSITVNSVAGTTYAATGTVNSTSVELYGYTLPTTAPDNGVYLSYAAFKFGATGTADRGYGFYNSNTGSYVFMVISLGADGNPMITEYVFQKA